MKILGAIFGNEPSCWDLGNELMSLKKDSNADLVELIATATGHYNVQDAWRSLLVRGMEKVTCMTGEFNTAGAICITNRELRLCG